MGLGVTNKRLVLFLFVFCLLFSFVYARPNISFISADGYLRVADSTDNYSLTYYETCNGLTSNYGLIEDGDGNIWVTCGDSTVARHDKDDFNNVTIIDTGYSPVYYLEYDAFTHSIWVGNFLSVGYLSKIDIATNTVINYATTLDRPFGIGINSIGDVYTISYGNGNLAWFDESNSYSLSTTSGGTGVYSRVLHIDPSDDSITWTDSFQPTFASKLNWTAIPTYIQESSTVASYTYFVLNSIGDAYVLDTKVGYEAIEELDKSNGYSRTTHTMPFRGAGIDLEQDDETFLWSGSTSSNEFCVFDIDVSWTPTCYNNNNTIYDLIVLNYTQPLPQTDFTPPVISNIVVDDIPRIGGFFISYDNAPKMYLTTDETASCRWSFTDEDYTGMDGYCVDGINTTNHICYLNNVQEILDTVYIACSDEFNNFHNNTSNYEQNIYVNLYYTTSTQEFEDIVLQDTWIRDSTPTQNLNSENIAIYEDVTSPENRWAIVEVDMNRLSLDNISKIGSVDLMLYSWLNEANSGETIYIHTHRVYSNFTWDESTMNWNLRPLPYQDYDPTIMDTTTHNIASGIGFINWSITSAIKDCYKNQEDTCTIYLTSTAINTEGGDNMYFKGSEVATVSQRPKLSIKYYEPRVWNNGDTYVRSNNVGSNYGTSTGLTLIGGATSYDTYVLIDGSDVEGSKYKDVSYGMYIESLTLTGDLELTYCNDDFNETTLTYSNTGTEVLNCDASPFLIKSFGDLSTFTINEFDITSIFNDDIDKKFTIKMHVTGSGDYISSYSRQSDWGGFSRYPHVTLGEVKVLKKEQPHFIYYNDFNDGNASLNDWTTNGWFVNSEGKAQGYNTWGLYYPNFIDTLYPEYNNGNPITLLVDWKIINGGTRHNCIGLYNDADVTMLNNREVMCVRDSTSLTQWITRGTVETIGSTSSEINTGQEYNLAFHISDDNITTNYQAYKDSSQMISNSVGTYGVSYGDLGFYRDSGSTSSSLITLDNLMIWDSSFATMPELLYITPIPNITIISPINNSVQNNSIFNVEFNVIDEDNLSLVCRVDVNETTLWSQQINNNTITNASINVTPDGYYYFEVKCDDDNYNNETSGEYFFNVSTVIPCAENWTASYGVCSTGDTQLKTYTDNNICNTTNDLPYDNGTFVACNYCLEDLVENLDTCAWNGSDFYTMTSYTDNNYFSCCAMTGILDDCSIDYVFPYNESQYNLCNYYADDFEIEYDEQALYGLLTSEKVYWKFYINATNTTEDYDCISYVKHMNEGEVGEIIQVNPTYIKKTEGFISIKDSYDDREYFRTVNGLGNVYFTKENLIMDERQYLFGIQCTGNGERLVSERVVTAEYEALNDPVNLAFWGKNNASGLFLGLMIIVFVLMLLGTIIYTYRRESR